MAYRARVEAGVELNPGLQALLQFLTRSSSRPSLAQTRIRFIEHSEMASRQLAGDGTSTLQDIVTKIKAAASSDQRSSTRCILIIEDIQPCHVEELGEAFDIDPAFFANYVGTDYRAVEKHPIPIWATSLPSESAVQEYCNIHYQRVIRLVSDIASPYGGHLITSTNVQRAVKQLAALSGVRIALARTCSSILRKPFESGFCLCLILVDDTRASIIARGSFSGDKVKFVTSQEPLVGPVRPRISSGDASTRQASLKASAKSTPSVFDRLEVDRLLATISAVNLSKPVSPGMLSLCVQPMRLALQEFQSYAITMMRYVRYYESSVKNAELAFRENDLDDLQVWRRRAFQVLQKLHTMHDFIEHWKQEETSGELIGLWLLKDIKHLIGEIEYHSRCLETMIPVTTAIVQLVDVRRSMDEARHVKHLTYLALVFIPLSFVSSLFSMADRVSPWNKGFWLYFAVAIPLTLFVIVLSLMMPLTARWSDLIRSAWNTHSAHKRKLRGPWTSHAGV